MAEYIEREALIRQIDEGFDKTEPTGEEQIGFLKCRKIARELSAADVAPVVQGRWDLLDDAGSKIVKWNCDRCNRISTSKTDYCPNCGADMREGVSG